MLSQRQTACSVLGKMLGRTRRSPFRVRLALASEPQTAERMVGGHVASATVVKPSRRRFRGHHSSVLRDRVTLQLRSVDRIYLQAYVPRLMSDGLLVRFLLDRGAVIASPALLGQIGRRYVEAIERFAGANAIPIVRFRRGESKEEIARPYESRSAFAVGSGPFDGTWPRVAIRAPRRAARLLRRRLAARPGAKARRGRPRSGRLRRATGAGSRARGSRSA
jgi:hypothetical protein